MNTVQCVSLNPSLDISNDCDEISSTHKVRLREQAIYPGGGGVNVARVINALGGRSELTYLVGGETGKILCGAIDQSQLVSKRFDSGVNTRLSFNLHEAASNLEYRFVSKGNAVTKQNLDPLIEYVNSLATDYLVLSGSLPEGIDVDVYAQMASSGSANGACVFLDCSGEALAATLESKSVHLVKPSMSELEFLAGKKLNLSKAISFSESLVQSNAAKYIAVSMGEEGAFVVSDAGVLHARAVKVDAQSAVGAGDSFLAAFIHRWVQHDKVENCLAWALAAGAAAVTTKGTKLCEIGTVCKLLSEVKVQSI